MAKKPTGDPRKKNGAQKPTPSKVNNTHTSQSGSPKVKKISNTSLKKNRSKNSVKLSDNERVSYRMKTSGDDIGRDIQNVLNKPQRESSLHYLKPLPPAKEPMSPYKRKVRRVLFYVITILVLVSVCCVLSLTVFFKIDEIEVEGKTRYNADEIISSSMINKGDNLILCNTAPGEKNIWEKYPYIETVDIHKRLFNKIVITVKEAVPTSIIESEGKYVLLSESGKIIDIDSKRQNNVPIILGAKLETPKLSSEIKYKNESVEDYIDQILEGAEKYKLGTIETIDISNLAKIYLERKNGLRIMLGAPENIDYKLKTAQKIIEKSLTDKDKGTLDVSLCSSEGGKSYYNGNQKPESSVESSKETSKNTSSAESSENSEASKTESSEASGEVTSEEPTDVTPSEYDGGDTGYDGGDNGYYDGGDNGYYDGGDNGYYDGGDNGYYDGGDNGYYDGGDNGYYDGGDNGYYDGGGTGYDGGEFYFDDGRYYDE